VVIDAGHGGTDSGARGTSGAVEKDVVLTVARVLRAELERLGYRVVMTRNDDSDPSYDDRAEIANAYRDPVFVKIGRASCRERV
jgi:N-acetylmuramoyl-L-alanine amidase